MATPAELLTALKKTRIDNSICATPEDLARAVEYFQDAVEDVVENVYTQITNIINTGGGNVTTPVYVIRALVNQVGGVTGSQTTFPFDNVTVLFSALGVDPVFNNTDNPPTAQNIQGRAFVYREPVILTSFNGLMWFADKTATNTIRAVVDHPGGVTTARLRFAFKDATAITGVIPPDGIGTVENIPNHSYNDGELIVLTQSDTTGNWVVVQDDDDLGDGTSGGVGSAGFGLELANTTFSLTDNQLASEGFELLGAASGIVEWGTVEEWMKTLPEFDAAKEQILKNDIDEIKWGFGSGGGFAITITDVPGMYIEADDNGIMTRYVGIGSAVDMVPFGPALGGDPLPEGYDTFQFDPDYDPAVVLSQQNADYRVYNMCGDDIQSNKHILWIEINGKRFISALACFDPPETA